MEEGDVARLGRPHRLDAEVEQEARVGRDRVRVAPGGEGLAVPLRGSPADALPHEQVLAVLVDPRAKARPRADQCLVGDRNARVVDREQARRREPRDDVAQQVGVLVAVELGQRHATSGVGVVLPWSDQPEEQPARGPALRIVELVVVDRVRALGDGSGHAARGAEPVERQRVVPSSRPRLHQRMRDERQRAGLPAGLVEHRLGQPRVDREPGAARRLLDGAAELGAVHRPDQHLVLGDPAGQPRERGARAVEVGADHEHGTRSAVGRVEVGGQRLDERGLLLRVVAEREQLLELVDAEEEGLARGRGVPGERGIGAQRVERRDRAAALAGQLIV